MTTLIYANAYSLFDYSNGASKSILLLLENWASAGLNIYAITSCVSYSMEGYLHTKEFGEEKANESQSIDQKINRFKHKGVHHSLIQNEFYKRESLNSASQELIYREAESFFTKAQRHDKNTAGFLSWGNLLLEESLFRRANELDIRTIFYLSNPSYAGKRPTTRYSKLRTYG